MVYVKCELLMAT